jgi:hypothetical protein
MRCLENKKFSFDVIPDSEMNQVRGGAESCPCKKGGTFDCSCYGGLGCKSKCPNAVLET